jgi:hypothetical protein
MNESLLNRMQFRDKVKDLIVLFDNWLSDPQDEVQLEQWKDAAEVIAHSFEFTDQEQDYVDKIIDLYEEQHRKKIERHQIASPPTVDKSYLDELLNRKQLEQRTPEWYQQMATIISASELGSLFAAPRQRAKLVMSKTVPYPARNQSLAVPSAYMSAFDWGIRFEPVVKQIYEHRYGVTIKELGRLAHSIDPRCMASPDGLIYDCPNQLRLGRLIEIKCPVTREIDGTIPKDYYAQMQMQLHVTGLPTCDYVEAVFSSVYNQMPMKEGPCLYDGWIALIRYAEPKGTQEFYYAYSPIHASSEWKPSLEMDEDIIEFIPWRLYQWSEQLVKRNEEWWVALQPVMDAFWADVEKAKQGEFTIPDSTRPAKRAKTEACLIQFHKMDEFGQPVL